jgi:molecular chaperone HscC
MMIGIDLGTTNSTIAVWRGGRPQLIPNSLGQVLTPSAVSVDDDGQLLVGMAARERQVTRPYLTATAFKRYMGTNRVARLGDREFLPEELSALVLARVEADAEYYLKESVNSAIITVPAYFNDKQRKATRCAGELAGLTVDRLINEPTAAALGCGWEGPGEQRISRAPHPKDAVGAQEAEHAMLAQLRRLVATDEVIRADRYDHHAVKRSRRIIQPAAKL